MGGLRDRGANTKRWGRNPGRFEVLAPTVARADTIREAIRATEERLYRGNMTASEIEGERRRLSILRLALERARA